MAQDTFNLNPNEYSTMWSPFDDSKAKQKREMDRTKNLYAKAMAEAEEKSRKEKALRDAEKAVYDYETSERGFRDYLREYDRNNNGIDNDVSQYVGFWKKPARDARWEQEDLEDAYYDAKVKGLVGIPEMSSMSDAVRNGIRTDYWQEGDRKKFADAADQVLFGYSDNPDGEREESSIPLAAYFVPGIGNALFLGEGVKDAATGNHMPGLVDLMFLGGSALGLAGGAYGVGKYLNNKVNPNRVKSARKAIKDYTPREVSGQVFTQDGRPVSSQDWRFAPEKKVPEHLKGKTIYDIDGNVIDLEAILNGKARR